MARRKDGEGSVRQLQDGSWECLMQSKYLNENGRPKRIKRKANTEQEAIKSCKLALKAWEKEFERGRDKKIDKTRTLGSYMEEYVDNVVKNRGVTGSTYKSYIYTLNANFYNYKISKLQLHMLNTVEFELYFDTLTHDKSRKTASVPIQLCKQLSTWLYGKSLIPEDYARFAETKHEKRDEYFRDQENEEKSRKQIFSDEDIVKFYNSYKQNLSEYSCVILLQLETMMRGSEVLNLHLEDIDFDHNTITVRSTMAERFKDNDKTKGLEKYEKVPKGGEERVIFMSEFAKELVLYMMEQTNLKSRHNPNNLLYPSFLKHGKARSIDAYEVQLKALCNKIGVDRDVRQRKQPSGRVINEGLNTHALRHTAITIANTSKNANVVVNALQAGHRAIRTENIYTHSNLKAQEQIETASKAILNLKPEKTLNELNMKQQGEDDKLQNMTEQDKELYQMYLKLKEKFE